MTCNEGYISGSCTANASEDISILNVPLTEFFRTFQNGDYEAAGVGLRDDNTGTITIELQDSSTITNAFLYWEALEDEGTLSDAGSLNDTPITGILIASSTDLCWGREATHYFRADVTGIATAGSNTLQITPGGSETLLEGASLVVIFSNPTFPTKHIIINDGGVALNGRPLRQASTTFSGFLASNAPIQARTTYIVGDGQSIFQDIASFNNTEVAGPEAFPGADGPLWDTLTIDVSELVAPGDISANAEISIIQDCLGWIAQVFSVTQTCPPCNDTVDFCAEILVPAPFNILRDSNSAAIDVSCLQCCLVPCETTGIAPDPCGGFHSCPTEIIGVRALGSINVYVNFSAINTDNQQTVGFSGQTTVCVDNVLCYICSTAPDPCSDDFFNESQVAITTTAETTTSCGNTLLSVRGIITLPTC
ncbi:DUF3344 domain-containing protein [Sutcliffiella horikoshii]|uniref:DUF3344 domain-containing protein n=1 Tax=Sutcliffiella horikoshii TaxID=79883 RepID=UPI0020423B4B|nr:DUF3344 domain-containing protein [Sutcliffiella horikoshii]MCM3618339.1 DUF3344 domain-containing protein [Sutcliffiella horikoshii]